MKLVEKLKAENDVLKAAAQEAIEEIEYWHKDMLSADERNHPRGNGWARVYDKLKAAISQTSQ